MRKLILTAATLLALASPSVAQEECITPEMITVAGAERQLPVFYILRGVDLGDADEAEVLIFKTEENYLAVAFERGCYVAIATFNQAGIEEFINKNTKKADGV